MVLLLYGLTIVQTIVRGVQIGKVSKLENV